jgi:hypothetical protein
VRFGVTDVDFDRIEITIGEVSGSRRRANGVARLSAGGGSTAPPIDPIV